MSDQRIGSFEEFWPFYVGEHLDATNRKLHFAGTTAAMACVATAIVTRRPLLALGALVAGYGPAWVGHFFVEKNKPASFKYPLWSLVSDFKMWGLTVVGEMDAEVQKVETARAAEAKQASVVEETSEPLAASVLN